MDLAQYRKRREELESQAKKFRVKCLSCFQPDFSCYCPLVKPFDPNIQFMILIHPIEVKRRIATGRMSHLCLRGSSLIQGEDFHSSEEVNSVLNDSSTHSVILYPGRAATNLTPLSVNERKAIFPEDKKLAVFVIDGTWNTARKMLHRSPNLQTLDQVCFTRPQPSTFRIRKQPAPGCVSTIEAVHETIELIGEARGFHTAGRAHDNLLNVFDSFVELQIENGAKNRKPRQGLSFRRSRSA